MIINFILTYLLSTHISQFSCYKTETYPGLINYYEPLTITNIAPPDQYYSNRLEFFAFHTYFKLDIKQGSRVVTHQTNILTLKSKSHIILNKNKLLNTLIEGKLNNDPNSYVHGTLNNKVLIAVIHTTDQTYYVEETKNYFKDYSNISSMIIFRNSDLNVTNWNCKRTNHTTHSVLLNYLFGPLRNLTYRAQTGFKHIPIDHVPPRLPEDIFYKQPIPKEPIPKPYKPVCVLNVIVDHTFYQTVGKRSFRKTAEEIIYIVTEANRIFELADFNGDGFPGDVSIQIKSMIIHKSIFEPNYNLYNERLSAEQVLQKISEYDFDGDCLGVGFVYRSFPKKVLGLAFIADPDPDGNLGGICQSRRYLSLRRKSMSYNAAFITLTQGGVRLPKLVSVISLAHEIGHSFGSIHDPKNIKACSPTPKDGGLYIMTESALTGSQRNNYKFSSCSLIAINKTLQTKAKCFINKHPICGNGIAEAFEECDCGHPLHCHETDKCCTPAGGIGKDAECTYRRQEGSKCSPKRDPCCTAECRIIPAKDEHPCNAIGDCKQQAYCDGFSGNCPESQPKQDGVACFDRTGMCINGQCVKPCKIERGLFDCECKQPEYSCTACCYSSNSTECLPTIRFGIIPTNGLPLLKPRGESCQDERGVCNILGDCIEDYKYLKDTMEDESETEGYLDTLTTLLIVLLVLLCLGLMLCLIVCVAPYAKFMHKPISNPDYTTVIVYQKPKQKSKQTECNNAVTSEPPLQIPTVCNPCVNREIRNQILMQPFPQIQNANCQKDLCCNR